MDKNFADVADKAVDKLAGGADAVAKAIAKVAPHAWEAAVRGALAEGISNLVVGSVVLGLTLYAIHRATKYIRTHKDDFDIVFPLMMFGGIALVAGLMFGIHNVQDGIQKVVAPEYHAALKILEAAK
jgi:hypothetical protein